MRGRLINSEAARGGRQAERILGETADQLKRFHQLAQ